MTWITSCEIVANTLDTFFFIFFFFSILYGFFLLFHLCLKCTNDSNFLLKIYLRIWIETLHWCDWDRSTQSCSCLSQLQWFQIKNHIWTFHLNKIYWFMIGVCVCVQVYSFDVCFLKFHNSLHVPSTKFIAINFIQSPYRVFIFMNIQTKVYFSPINKKKRGRPSDYYYRVIFSL